MKSSTNRRVIIALGALVVSGSLFILPSGDTTTNASHTPGTPQFKPSIEFKLCNDLPSNFDGPELLQGAGGACVENSAQDGNPDLTFDFAIPAGDLNFSPDTLILTLSDEFAIAADADMPNGYVVGGIDATISLAFSANPCDNTMNLEFILYDSTTDTNTVIVVPPGEISTLAADGLDAFPGKADQNSPAVTRYPDFTNKLFDPDGSGDATGGFSPVVPHARYAGLTLLAAEWQLFQIVTFAPGALKATFSASEDNKTHPFSRLDAGLGWTSIVVLNNPITAESVPSPNTEFCSLLSVTAALLGSVDTTGDTVGDTDRLTSPAAVGGIDGEGTQLAQLYVLSQRDLDGDGIEHSLDTCPHVANVEDPYTTAGPDLDALDSACDPNASQTNTDGVIDIFDVNILDPYFFTTCVPT